MTDHERNIAEDLAIASMGIDGAILCRVWTMRPGDLCSTCTMASECHDRRACLHLAASVGLTRRLDGPFRRFPLGAREVGKVARTLQPHVLNQGLEAAGVAEPAWLALHRIAGFGAFPLHTAGKCLGVQALFATEPLGEAAVGAIAALGRIAGRALLAAGSMPPAPSPPRVAAIDFAAIAPQPAASMVEVQRRAILAALARTGGKLSGPGGAAEILGMKPTTLESRIRRLGLRKPPRLPLR